MKTSGILRLSIAIAVVISTSAAIAGSLAAQDAQVIESPKLRLPSDAQPVTNPSQLRKALVGKLPDKPIQDKGPVSPLYPKIAPAIVLITSPYSSGTGFVVDREGWIITNHHVIALADVDEPTGAQKVDVSFGRLQDGKMQLIKEKIPAVVYKSSEEKDLALLKLARLPQGIDPLPTIGLASRAPRPGDDCASIGHPGPGTLWAARSGEVSGIATWPGELRKRLIDELTLPEQFRPEFEKWLATGPQRKVVVSTCSIAGGDSGGPLVNDQGQLIGVTFATPPAAKDSAVFSYQVHVDELRAFLEERPTSPTGYVPDPWPKALLSQALDLDKDGTVDTAVFGLQRGSESTGIVVDLDQDSEKKNPGKKPKEIIDTHAWDFEYSLVPGQITSEFYDTDNDGLIDLVMIGAPKQPILILRKGDRWKSKKAHGETYSDPNLFTDPMLRERFQQWLNPPKDKANDPGPATQKPAPGPQTKSPIPPVGDYKDYALSKDATSYDQGNPVNDGLRVSKVLEKGDGWVKLAAASSNTVLKMPMGWQADEDGQKSTFFTPNKKVRFVNHFNDMAAEFGKQITFAEFRMTARVTLEEKLAGSGQQSAKVEQLDLPDGSIALKVRGIRTESGEKNALVQVFTPDSADKSSHYCMSLSLITPEPEFDRFLGLLGLILRDRQILWAK
jgi:S1-C subfamily serine protease